MAGVHLRTPACPNPGSRSRDPRHPPGSTMGIEEKGAPTSDAPGSVSGPGGSGRRAGRLTGGGWHWWLVHQCLRKPPSELVDKPPVPPATAQGLRTLAIQQLGDVVGEDDLQPELGPLGV